MDAPYDSAAHAALRRCFDSGRTRSLDWRYAQLDGLSEFLRSEERAIAEVLHADLRKSEAESWLTETSWLASEAAYVRKRLKRWIRPERVEVPLRYRPARASIHREPLGVVLVFGAWNYPVQLCLAPLIGALAAGNCVVLKPSEVAPATSSLLASRLGCYLDSDAVRVVQGGLDVAESLPGHRFDHIFFTGSRAVGRSIMAAASRHLTPVTLELGGKCPCIVTESADLAAAARRIVWAKFMNAGQTCIAPDYLLVHESVEERLLTLLRQAIERFYGPDPRSSPDYPRIIDARHASRLEALLVEGTVVTGGEVDTSARYVAPTIVRNVPEGSPLLDEEIFGPILPVIRYSGCGEACALVRSKDDPLAVYLFSGSRPDLDFVARRTVSGGICFNDLLFQTALPGLPFGGRGGSGMGAYHGRAGFETFSARRSLFVRSPFPDTELRYPPYGKRKFRLLRTILNLLP